MEPEGLEVSEVCFHKKIAENRTIQSIHRTENIIENLTKIYSETCTFKSLEIIRNSIKESRKFFLEWESDQPRPSQKVRQARISKQNDVQMHQGVDCGSVGNANISNLAPAYSMAIASSETAREFGTDDNEAIKVRVEGSMSQFDCDLKREVERVMRQKNCAHFNGQMLSRFHGDLSAQTGLTVPPSKSSNAVTNRLPLSRSVTEKKSSPVSIKQRLMNESGKIFKIAKREIRPSANKAKLNDWLAHNKRQPIKRKLNEDDDCETHIIGKRVKMTQIDERERSVGLQHRLPTSVNSKRAPEKSLIPRPIQSEKTNNTQTSNVVCKEKHINKAMLNQSECIKPVSASRSEAMVHESFIPRLVKVTKQCPVIGVNHITNANNKLTKANNFKPASVNSKAEAVNSKKNAPTFSVKQTSCKDVKPLHMHDTLSIKSKSIISKQTFLSKQIYTSFTVTNSMKPTPRKSSKHSLPKSITEWNKYF